MIRKKILAGFFAERGELEMKQINKRTVLYIGAAVIIIALICLAFYFKSVSDYKQAVSEITFQNIDVTKIADGTYTGECNVNFIYAEVEVTVKEGLIENIEILEHRNERGQAAETVIDKIVTEQKIEVDAISGATNSSTVLKKAVENALSQ